MNKWLWCSLFFAANVLAAVSVTDDSGSRVTLPQPARRVISLSPHATEMMYAIGAGAQLVGVTRFSDYPDEVRTVPVVGDFRQVDLERVLSMKPDLLIVWSGGNPPKQIAKLERAGIPVFYSNPHRLDDIPDNMMRLGILTGHETSARKTAARWKGKLDDLKRRYRNRDVLRVFYQVSDVPLFTLNGQHIVNEVIEMCGGRNIFAGLPALAPNVGIEAVLASDPEVIVSTRGMGTEDGLSGWKRFRTLDAVRYGNLFRIDPDWLDRPGPRMIRGAEMLCKKLDEGRKNRQAFR